MTLLPRLSGLPSTWNKLGKGGPVDLIHRMNLKCLFFPLLEGLGLPDHRKGSSKGIQKKKNNDDDNDDNHNKIIIIIIGPP